LRLAYARPDALAGRGIALVKRIADPTPVVPRPVNTVAGLQRSRADLVLLGWTPKVFDAYNILDLFPCGSAFNIAHWCQPSYDALMRRAVRTLDDRARWGIERQLLYRLESGPAVALSNPPEYVWLKPGVRGFSWSPIGFYELSGMTRS
jgi:ABC-type transport system substrate-binding protein